MTDLGFGTVADLLARAPRPPGGRPYAGASDEQLSRLEHQLGYPLPPSMAAWLSLCNGIVAGPGGLYGVATDEDFLNINSILSLYPDWRDRKWLPVAGDGTGNHYVLDASRNYLDGDAIYFVDASENAHALAYVVASDLRGFLTFLLDRELGRQGWPFDANYVLGRDPGIARVTCQDLLPWST